MIEPSLVQGAALSPGRCFVCGGHEGPFIDTHVDVIGDGRFYLCARICLPLAGRAAGYLSPEQTQELLDVVVRASDQVTRLEEELAEARANRLVPEADLEMLYAKLEEDRQERRAFERAWAAAQEHEARPTIDSGVPPGPWQKTLLPEGGGKRSTSKKTAA